MYLSHYFSSIMKPKSSSQLSTFTAHSMSSIFQQRFQGTLSGNKPGSPVLRADSLPSEPSGKPHNYFCIHWYKNYSLGQKDFWTDQCKKGIKADSKTLEVGYGLLGTSSRMITHFHSLVPKLCFWCDVTGHWSKTLPRLLGWNTLLSR